MDGRSDGPLESKRQKLVTLATLPSIGHAEEEAESALDELREGLPHRFHTQRMTFESVSRTPFNSAI
jgi:hypothetical protein